MADRDRGAIEDRPVAAERVGRMGVQQIGIDLEEQLLEVLVPREGAPVPGDRQLLVEPLLPAAVERRDPILHRA